MIRYAELPSPPGIESSGVRSATSLAFTEGPAVDAEGSVYFSDISNNRIMKLTPDGVCRVFREPRIQSIGDVRNEASHGNGANVSPDDVTDALGFTHRCLGTSASR